MSPLLGAEPEVGNVHGLTEAGLGWCVEDDIERYVTKDLVHAKLVGGDGRHGYGGDPLLWLLRESGDDGGVGVRVGKGKGWEVCKVGGRVFSIFPSVSTSAVSSRHGTAC